MNQPGADPPGGPQRCGACLTSRCSSTQTRTPAWQDGAPLGIRPCVSVAVTAPLPPLVLLRLPSNGGRMCMGRAAECARLCTPAAPLAMILLVRAALLTGRLQAWRQADSRGLRPAQGAPRHHGARPGRAGGARAVRAHSQAVVRGVDPAHAEVCGHHCAHPRPDPVPHRLLCNHKAGGLCACAAEQRACAWLRECHEASRWHVGTCAWSCTVHIHR
jgi:hypothetical protein